MILALISVLLEWMLYFVPFIWKRRRYFLTAPVTLTAFTAGGLMVEDFSVLWLFVLLASLFRIFNQLRIAENRMHDRYLLGASRRTGLTLGLVQIALISVAGSVYLAESTLLSVLVAVQAVMAGLIFLTTVRNIVKSKSRPLLTHYSDKELPTVTVAIPACNETADLEDCLRSVLANNYPKLEVLVLDDCSQDKTSEIIRNFAHDGVRFIKGAEPEERWLAKNRAYDRLADEANGELVLFCGVDVRFGPEAVRSLVTTLLERKKDMVSVMPRRLSSGALAAFIQPMRYWWELALPRRYFNRPAVLSTCWIIRRKKLKSLGGFEAVRHAIIPEGYFARELVRADGYSFLRADDVLDVQTRKTLADQRETAIRMRYPQIRRRPEMALFMTVAQLLLMLGPFVVVASTIWSDFGTPQLLAAIACVLLVLTHVSIVQVSNPANVLVAVLNLPLAVLTELVLSYMSMFKYEFSKVDWKGRNICIPVMHVVPHLPKPNAENLKSQ